MVRFQLELHAFKMIIPSMKISLSAFVLLFGIGVLHGSDRIVSVEYPPSTKPGELVYGVTYNLWIPDGVKHLRAIIVHQHGCGVGACKGGETAAYDLHWQALARKWDCALLGPSYHQGEGDDCRKWCDPRNGSEKRFLQGLKDLAMKAKHPELVKIPWCLWGHSGGGFWASLMHTLHPERIVAIWFRSGTAFGYWENGETLKPKLSNAMFKVPMVCNPGVGERDHKRMHKAWNGTLAMFKAYRAKGAPIAFAPDPRTVHECGDSRYLAIPFFDACLDQRLPEKPRTPLRPIDGEQAWLAPLLGEKAVEHEMFDGDRIQSVWLPNEKVAKAWAEYVATGVTEDHTPPPPPLRVMAKDAGNETIHLTWSAHADFESGVRQFVVYRNGKELARVPEKPKGRFGRPLFQNMSYHDTPEKPLPKMTFTDKDAASSKGTDYAVATVNGVGDISTPTVAVILK